MQRRETSEIDLLNFILELYMYSYYNERGPRTNSRQPEYQVKEAWSPPPSNYSKPESSNYKCAFDARAYQREYDSIDQSDSKYLKELNLRILDQVE